jgi:hypothetical protein
MAFWPPSVTQAAPSGPRMTPCGAAPWPSETTRMPPSRGSSRLSVPLRWPQNHIVPSPAAVTSREPTRPLPGAAASNQVTR